jgi:hypothetical protein
MEKYSSIVVALEEQKNSDPIIFQKAYWGGPDSKTQLIGHFKYNLTDIYSKSPYAAISLTSNTKNQKIIQDDTIGPLYTGVKWVSSKQDKISLAGTVLIKELENETVLNQEKTLKKGDLDLLLATSKISNILSVEELEIVNYLNGRINSHLSHIKDPQLRELIAIYLKNQAVQEYYTNYSQEKLHHLIEDLKIVDTVNYSILIDAKKF